MSYDLLGRSTSAHEVFAAVCKAVYAHGGDDDTVRRIMSNPDALVTFAKSLVGRVWELADTAQSLKVDWNADETAVKREMNDLNVFCALQLYRLNSGDVTKLLCSDPRPEGAQSYKLVHYGREVWKDLVRQNNNVAGYRELCAFVRDFVVPMGLRTKIAALRSDFEFQGEHACITFDSTLRDNKKSIGFRWEPRFATDWFFLVRIPVTS